VTPVVRVLRRHAVHGKRMFALTMVNAVVASVAFGLAEGIGPLDILYWYAQTRTTTGYGTYPTETIAGKWIAIWFMETNFWMTLLLAAHALAWLLPEDKFDHHEQAEVMAELDELRADVKSLLAEKEGMR
jgi:hypothetical protein